MFNCRTGGRSTLVVPNVKSPYLKKGDNIGIALDLSVPIMTFFFNGVKVRETVCFQKKNNLSSELTQSKLGDKHFGQILCYCHRGSV